MVNDDVLELLCKASDLLHENSVTLERMDSLATERDEVVKSLRRENQELRDVLDQDLANVLSTLQDISTSEEHSLDSTKTALEELEAVKKVGRLRESLSMTTEQNKALLRENALLRGELTAIQNEQRSSK
jgi:hypothetical protein